MSRGLNALKAFLFPPERVLKIKDYSHLILSKNIKTGQEYKVAAQSQFLKWIMSIFFSKHKRKFKI